MRVSEQQIMSLSKELWEAQLGLSLTEGEVGPDEADPIRSSCVKVSGDWKGAIVVECPESVARHASVMLFSTDSDSASAEDIEDALKELADMVGRKVRGLLPETAKLSRATVLDGENGSPALSEMSGLSDVQFNCEGRPVRIALLQAEVEPAPELEPAPAA